MTETADYAAATASETVAALQARQVSSLELTQAAIRRIEARDGAINAVVVRDFDRALDQARAADARLAAGEQAPLLGVPMTVKESFDIEGQPTTWGLEAYRDHRATRDAEAVRLLKAAGAVILGKTNVPVNLAEWYSENPIYGRTVNPLNPERSPGGSSGGSAAALLAGFTPLELGSDIGGSIRIPAAFCGVYGHKPSYGLVPFGGHTPGGRVAGNPVLSVRGPLARSAGDLDLALNVVAKPGGEDGKAYATYLPPPRRERLSDFRVLVLTSHPGARTSRDIVQAMDRLARDLAAEGCVVERESELLPDPAASFELYRRILLTHMSRGGTPSDRDPVSAHEWLDLLDQQARLRWQWAALFDVFDVVLTPTFVSSAIPHQTEADWRKRSLMIDGEARPYGEGLVWPSVALLPNLPATAMPLGLDAEGMPLSVQVIGPYLEDRTTIRFAELAGPGVVLPV